MRRTLDGAGCLRMKLACPSCAAEYEVPDGALGADGRKVRCRACGASWFQPPPAAAAAREAPPLPSPPRGPPAIAEAMPAPSVAEPDVMPPAPRRGRWGVLLLLGLVVLVAVLGVLAATLAWGPREVASQFGLARDRVQLGIAISRPPDWRMIADGGQLFAVTGRVWNPTRDEQSVPDIRVELKDARERTLYAWTITRPAATIAPGASIDFDGASLTVPPNSTHVSVSFAGAGDR